MIANRSSIINGLILAAGLITLSSFKAAACTQDGKRGLLPENNMRISMFSKNVNGMTEAKFNELIDRVEKVYAPIVDAKGKKLTVVKNWADDTVNAYANQSGSDWYVNMFGGLARHPAVTEDGLMLVVCHELGHHLGGAPKYRNMGWASNEGQADYWGTMKCMKRVYADDNSLNKVTREIDAEAQAQCDATFRNTEDRALCARISMAGKSLADLFASFGGGEINFKTPDKKVVSSTNDGHPAAQCRLDTYFQGTLCTKEFADDVSDTDAKKNTCIAADGFTSGVRPLCWYKPQANELALH